MGCRVIKPKIHKNIGICNSATVTMPVSSFGYVFRFFKHVTVLRYKLRYPNRTSFFSFLICIFCFWFFIFGFNCVHASFKTIEYPLLRTDYGSRPLAMGSAYLAVADDSNALFYNPGGLPFAKGFVATLANSFKGASYIYAIDDVSSLGFAITSTNISNVTLTGAGPSTSTSGEMLLFSYGRALSENLGLGLNYKYLLRQSLQAGISSESVSGYDLDFGLLWKSSGWISLGLTAVNLLQSRLATWPTGGNATTRLLRLGIAAKVIGDLSSPIYLEDRELLLSADVESAGDFRFGAEFGIAKKWFVRTGIRDANLNYGLAYHWGKWGVDLTSSYENFGGGRITYLSLLYFPQEQKKFKKREIPDWLAKGQLVAEVSLKDNLQTYDERLDVFGNVNPGVKIKINSTDVSVNPSGGFHAQVPLRSGKNLIVLEARYDGQKKTYKYKILRKAKVVIAEEKVIEEKIKKAAAPEEKQKLEEKKKEVLEKKEKLETLVTMGVIEVKPDVEFKLEARVSRGELAAWLVRAAKIPISPVTKDVFKDVPKDHPLAFYIKAVTDMALLTPYPDGTFRPNRGVTEAEGQLAFSRFGVTK